MTHRKLALLLAALGALLSLCLTGATLASHWGPLPQCEDGHDNDWDGLVDWPDDPGCYEGTDNEEYNTPPPPPAPPPSPPPAPPPAPPPPPPPPIPQCEDGRDNDGDGLVDFGQDPGCSDWGDNEEYNAPPPPPPPPPAPAPTSLPCDGSEGVYLYEDWYYQGRCSRFVDDSAESSGWTVGNDQVSSVRIVGAFSAALYEHANYAGASSTFGEDSPDPNGWAVGNDTASSIAVERVESALACERSNTCPGADAADYNFDQSGYEPQAADGDAYLVYPYSLGSCPAGDPGKIRDPVGVVFYDYGTADRALNHVRAHTGWSVRPTPDQYFESWGNCGKTYGERASGRWFQDRFHVRVRKTSHRYGDLGTTALATPHHEDFVSHHYFWVNKTCVHAVDKGGVETQGGTYSGFMWGRDELYNKLATSSHHPSFWAYWRHTAERHQCDGDWAGGDGWVAFIGIPNSYH